MPNSYNIITTFIDYEPSNDCSFSNNVGKLDERRNDPPLSPHQPCESMRPQPQPRRTTHRSTSTEEENHVKTLPSAPTPLASNSRPSSYIPFKSLTLAENQEVKSEDEDDGNEFIC